MILQDKVALVTGGTSGIGRATAIAYAQQQAKVVVVGRRIDEGEETVRLIKEAGGEAIFVQADVTKEADVKAMVDKAVSVFGRLDIAFNNAGTVGENPSLIEQTEAEYDRTMNVNVKGVWLSMMKRNAHKFFKMLLPVSILGLGSVLILFQRPIAAQFTPQIIPRIDTIKPQESNLPPAYRLTISRPQDIVYVACPGGYEPELSYLRNVKAIQCERYQSK